LDFWTKGEGELTVKAENITQVSGISEDRIEIKCVPGTQYAVQKMQFTTNAEPFDNKRTVKVSFKNMGNKEIFLDDMMLLLK
jgi:hypothetical protein